MTRSSSSHSVRITTVDILTLTTWLRSSNMTPDSIGKVMSISLRTLAQNLRENNVVTLPKNTTKYDETIHRLLGVPEPELDMAKLKATLNLQDPSIGEITLDDD